MLPLSPGRAERHGFEYYRHGTLSLYAALETETGRVHGKTAARHTSQRLRRLPGRSRVALCPPRQEIHIILDNLSAHKTAPGREFLEQHPHVQFHFTPTYSSWLNQVELWFAKIERDVIARGVFTSVPDLARKLRRYINAYSTNARPIHGNTQTRPAASVVTNSLRQATSLTFSLIESARTKETVSTHPGISRIVRWRRIGFVLPLKTLQTGPRFQQRVVHREVLVRHPSLLSRMRHHPRQKLLRHLGLQQAVAVFGEHRASHTASSKFNPTNQRNNML